MFFVEYGGNKTTETITSLSFKISYSSHIFSPSFSRQTHSSFNMVGRTNNNSDTPRPFTTMFFINSIFSIKHISIERTHWAKCYLTPKYHNRFLRKQLVILILSDSSNEYLMFYFSTNKQIKTNNTMICRVFWTSIF